MSMFHCADMINTLDLALLKPSFIPAAQPFPCPFFDAMQEILSNQGIFFGS
jgi:hypothetical protein